MNIKLKSREVNRCLQPKFHAPIKLTPACLGIFVNISLLFNNVIRPSSRIILDLDKDINFVTVDQRHVSRFPDNQTDLVNLLLDCLYLCNSDFGSFRKLDDFSPELDYSLRRTFCGMSKFSIFNWTIKLFSEP